MVVPIVPIGVMLGKADIAFKMFGGSSIVFNVIRSRIFGKVLRAVEYPDGHLNTIRIYRMRLYNLKSVIAETQPPPFPTAFLEPYDIKQISVFTSPHFSEAIASDADVSALAENSWLFWSKDTYQQDPIPMRNVKLDGSHILKKSKQPENILPNDLILQDVAISLSTKVRKTQQFSRWQYDRIIDLAIDRDAGLLAIARNFSSDQDEFRNHCVRLLKRRDPRSILIAAEADDSQSAHSDTSPDDDSEDAPKRSLEPQVELVSRE